MLGKIEGRRRRGRQRMREWELSGYGFEQTPGDSKDREAWSATVHAVAKNWT